MTWNPSARRPADVAEQALERTARAALDLGVRRVVHLDRQREVHDESVGHRSLRSGG
jgi:hypothetical protein